MPMRPARSVLILLLYVIDTLLGSTQYDLAWVVVALLTLMALMPVVVTVAFTVWAATRPASRSLLKHRQAHRQAHRQEHRQEHREVKNNKTASDAKCHAAFRLWFEHASARSCADTRRPRACSAWRELAEHRFVITADGYASVVPARSDEASTACCGGSPRATG